MSLPREHSHFKDKLADIHNDTIDCYRRHASNQQYLGHTQRPPHCQITFRVTLKHLQLADGAVRCGACLQIFKAHEHLTSGQIPSNSLKTLTPTPQTAYPNRCTTTNLLIPMDGFITRIMNVAAIMILTTQTLFLTLHYWLSQITGQ
ncbi:MAG: hypothetical protein KAG53_05685 [Endozoicomonadaceae bacterium]|nr:hypothetical protein [Endozoicomonadaceae bacterium]